MPSPRRLTAHPQSPHPVSFRKGAPHQQRASRPAILALPATHLQVAILVDENVARLEVAVDDAGRVDVFQAAQDLVQKVLDKLLFERPRGEETVQVGAEELGDKVAVGLVCILGERVVQNSGL